MIGLQGQHSRIITGDEELAVYRELSAIYKDGKLLKYEVTSFLIICNIQPLNGRDLQMVEEGDRAKEQYWIFVENLKPYKPNPLSDNTTPPLTPISSLLVNDRVSRKGVNFTVQQVEDWGAYSRARIVRIDIGPEQTP